MNFIKTVIKKKKQNVTKNKVNSGELPSFHGETFF